MIEVKSVNKSFKSINVLHDVNFTIQNKEIVGLIGPNGAGKSTLVNIMLGLLQPDHGTVRCSFNKKTEIGVMQQADSFPDDLTPVELIHMHLSLYGLKMNHEEVVNKLKEIKLVERKSNLIKNLSGGEKRRLSFLLSIIHNPTFIILDEPTNAMDIESVELLWKKIHELKNSGCTLIIISHDLDQIDRFVDRAIILHQKNVVLDQTLEEVHAKKVIDYTVNEKVEIPENIKIMHMTSNTICVEQNNVNAFDDYLTQYDIATLKQVRCLSIRDLYRKYVEGKDNDNNL